MHQEFGVAIIDHFFIDIEIEVESFSCAENHTLVETLRSCPLLAMLLADF